MTRQNLLPSFLRSGDRRSEFEGLRTGLIPATRIATKRAQQWARFTLVAA